MSTPACSSVIAQLCLSTCGWSLLPASDGHRSAAALVWVARRRSIASRLSRLPVRVQNSGSRGPAWIANNEQRPIAPALPSRLVGRVDQHLCLLGGEKRDRALLKALWRDREHALDDVLAAADGEQSKEIAARLGCSTQTVGRWRGRFARRGIDGLHDEPRPGKPRQISDEDVERVIVKTLE